MTIMDNQFRDPHINISSFLGLPVFGVIALLANFSLQPGQFLQFPIQILTNLIPLPEFVFQVPDLGLVHFHFLLVLLLVFLDLAGKGLHELFHLRSVAPVLLLQFSDVLLQFLVLLGYLHDLRGVLEHLLFLAEEAVLQFPGIVLQ